jgi:hypothetical protein
MFVLPPHPPEGIADASSDLTDPLPHRVVRPSGVHRFLPSTGLRPAFDRPFDQ